MTREAWLAAHPYLRPVADLQAAVDAAADRLAIAPGAAPDWATYAGDFYDGVPLLQSGVFAFDQSDTEDAVLSLIRTLARTALPATLAEQCQALAETAPLTTSQPGLLRYLTWAVLARHLRPVVDAFDRWRDEERWLRNYCPMCGEPPAMAQLVGKDPGRMRFLVCGCCRTRWRYRRTGCPFCEARDDHRLPGVAVEGEAGLRVDYCEVCHGYVKTYDGAGSEDLLLADWTSLHLDVVARDRGLKRLAASLFEI